MLNQSNKIARDSCCCLKLQAGMFLALVRLSKRLLFIYSLVMLGVDILDSLHNLGFVDRAGVLIHRVADGLRRHHALRVARHADRRRRSSGSAGRSG